MAAAVGGIAAYALHARDAQPLAVKARSEAGPALVAEDPAKLFGAIIVEPEWLAKTPEKTDAPAILATLGPTSPAPAPASVQPPAPAPAPTATNQLPDTIPLPPVRDVPLIDDTVPLPPVRPPEFAEPAPNLEAPRLPAPALAPADNRNIFQKLLGIVQQPGAVVASRPPAAPPAQPAAPSAPPPPASVVVKPADSGQGRAGFAGLLGGFSAATGGLNLDRLGYDRQTAIYDISARTVYLPDGSRLEAHSGLGAALDDLRFVSERAVGPTPPHLYELTMREALFHGVQAIRLTPVGEGAVYGRAGLLAHPYMLGPNGDSNGCVSVKDYDAFLRAYQNGQIRKLAVVARI